jgi:YidC/Oxa1 family membrane protein insertase
MLDFDIQSQGLNKVLNAAKPLNLEWDLKAYSNEKSLTTEIVTLRCIMSMRMVK